MESSIIKRQRVPRACDSCRLKKSKCDSSTPCTICVQRDIPCIRRHERRHISNPHELLDTLVKAVHVLYQACNPHYNITENNYATTHTILQSLGLIEQGSTEFEDEFSYTGSEGLWSPITSADSSTTRVFTTSGASSRSDVLSPLSHQTTVSDVSLLSFKSDGCVAPLQTVLPEESLATPPPSQSLLFTSSLNDFHNLGPYRPDPSQRGIRVSEAAKQLDGVWSAETSPAYPFYDETIFVELNDISPRDIPSPQQEPFGRKHSSERNSPNGEAFGFDPVPAQFRNDMVKMEKIGMISSWSGFGKHIGRGNCDNLPASLAASMPIPALRDTYSEAKGDIGRNVPSMESGHKYESESIIAPLPSVHETDSSMSVDLDSPTSLPTMAFKPLKRGRKRIGDSSPARLQAPESEKRRIALEKNRRAAMKCREKKRLEIHQLREMSHETAAENSLLQKQTMQMQRESSMLRFELLTHASHPGCYRPEELRNALSEPPKQLPKAKVLL